MALGIATGLPSDTTVAAHLLPSASSSGSSGSDKLAVRVTAEIGKQSTCMDFRVKPGAPLSKLVLAWCREHRCPLESVLFLGPDGRELAPSTTPALCGWCARAGVDGDGVVEVIARPRAGAEALWPATAPPFGTGGSAAEWPEGGLGLLPVKIVAKGEDGTRTIAFRCPPTAPLRRLAASWCRYQGITEADAKFILHGRPLQEADTLASRGLTPKQGGDAQAAVEILAEPATGAASAVPSPKLPSVKVGQQAALSNSSPRVVIRFKPVGALQDWLETSSRTSSPHGVPPTNTLSVYRVKMHMPIMKAITTWSAETGLAPEKLLFTVDDREVEDGESALTRNWPPNAEIFIEASFRNDPAKDQRSSALRGSHKRALGQGRLSPAEAAAGSQRGPEGPPDGRVLIRVEHDIIGVDHPEFKILPTSPFSKVMDAWKKGSSMDKAAVYRFSMGSRILEPHDTPESCGFALLREALVVKVQAVVEEAPPGPVEKFTIQVVATDDLGESKLDATVKATTPMEKVMRAWCQRFERGLEEAAFLHDGRTLRLEDTLGSLGWTKDRGVFIVTVVPRGLAPKEVAAPDGNERLLIEVVADSDFGRSVAKYDIKPTTPFSKVMREWCRAQDVALENARFELAGRELRSEETPLTCGWRRGGGSLLVEVFPRLPNSSESTDGSAASELPAPVPPVGTGDGCITEEAPAEETKTATGGRPAQSDGATTVAGDVRGEGAHEEVPKEAGTDAAEVIVRVLALDAAGDVSTDFPIPSTCPFEEKVFRAWCDHFSIMLEEAEFTFEGKELRPTDTPETCGWALGRGVLEVKARRGQRLAASTPTPGAMPTAGALPTVGVAPTAEAAPVPPPAVESTQVAEAVAAPVTAAALNAGAVPIAESAPELAPSAGAAPTVDAALEAAVPVVAPEAQAAPAAGATPMAEAPAVHTPPAEAAPTAGAGPLPTPAVEAEATAEVAPSAGAVAEADAALSPAKGEPEPAVPAETRSGSAGHSDQQQQPQQQQEPKVSVEVYAADGDGAQVTTPFRMRLTTPFIKMMEAWSDVMHIPLEEVCFKAAIVEGSEAQVELRPTDTVTSIGWSVERGTLKVEATPRESSEPADTDAQAPTSAAPAQQVASPPEPAAMEVTELRPAAESVAVAPDPVAVAHTSDPIPPVLAANEEAALPAQAPPLPPPAAPPAKVSVEVGAEGINGRIYVNFKMSVTTPLRKMMEGWSKELDVPLEEAIFLIGDKEVKPEDTLETFGYKPGHEGVVTVEAQAIDPNGPPEPTSVPISEPGAAAVAADVTAGAAVGTGPSPGLKADAPAVSTAAASATPQASTPAANAPPAQEAKVLLKVVAESGTTEHQPIDFNLRRTLPFGKMMQAWCKHNEFPVEAVVFKFEGRELQKEDTLDSLGWSPPADGEAPVVRASLREAGAAAAEDAAPSAAAPTVVPPPAAANVTAAAAPAGRGRGGGRGGSGGRRRRSSSEADLNAPVSGVASPTSAAGGGAGTAAPNEGAAKTGHSLAAEAAAAAGSPFATAPLGAEAARSEAAGAATAARQQVEVRVEATGNEGTNTTNVKMRLGMAFEKMMAAWCKQYGIDREVVCFTTGGRKLLPSDTPASCGCTLGSGPLLVKASFVDTEQEDVDIGDAADVTAAVAPVAPVVAPAAPAASTPQQPVAVAAVAAVAPAPAEQPPALGPANGVGGSAVAGGEATSTAKTPGTVGGAAKEKVGVEVRAESPQGTSVQSFKMKLITPFEKMMNAWCSQMGVAVTEAAFMYQGQVLRAEDTPQSLGWAVGQDDYIVQALPRDAAQEAAQPTDEAASAAAAMSSATAAADSSEGAAQEAAASAANQANAASGEQPVGAVEIVVIARDASGGSNALQFRMKLTTAFQKMMARWCAHHQIAQENVAFLREGRQLMPDDTPGSLGWEESKPGEEITINAEPRGNGAAAGDGTTGAAARTPAKRKASTDGLPAPKRIATAQTRWSRQRRPQLLQAQPELKGAELSRKLSAEWKALALEERRPFEEEEARERAAAKAAPGAQEAAASPAPVPSAPAVDHPDSAASTDFAAGVPPPATAEAPPSTAPAAVPPPATAAAPAGVQLSLLVVAVGSDGNTEETRFRLKSITLMGKMMAAWCTQHSIAEEECTFIYNGRAMRPGDTLASLGHLPSAGDAIVQAVPRDSDDAKNAIKAREASNDAVVSPAAHSPAAPAATSQQAPATPSRRGSSEGDRSRGDSLSAASAVASAAADGPASSAAPPSSSAAQAGSPAPASPPPKRPPSAYTLFTSARRPALMEAQPELKSLGDISKALAAEWKALTPEEKKPYEEQAATQSEHYSQEKSAYQERHPGVASSRSRKGVAGGRGRGRGGPRKRKSRGGADEESALDSDQSEDEGAEAPRRSARLSERPAEELALACGPAMTIIHPPVSGVKRKRSTGKFAVKVEEASQPDNGIDQTCSAVVAVASSVPASSPRSQVSAERMSFAEYLQFDRDQDRVRSRAMTDRQKRKFINGEESDEDLQLAKALSLSESRCQVASEDAGGAEASQADTGEEAA